MSLRRNIIANYASQGYVTLAGLVMLPVYLQYLGAEAYGLVGLFAMLNAVFMLLDVGLTPTLSREAARFRGGAIDANTLRGLLRLLETIFLCVALIAVLLFVSAAGFFATQWLQLEQLTTTEVRGALILMGLTIPLRWMSGLYRGAINGFERQVWLATFNSVIATGRFGGVLLVFHLIAATPVSFFAYQLLVAGLELGGLVYMAYRLLPEATQAVSLRKSWSSLKGLLGFSLVIAFTGAVWVLITQVDKIVLSKVLSLSDYGYFSLAVVVAGGVNLIGAPIIQALLPRLTHLIAQGHQTEAIVLYRKATQLIVILAIPAALTLAIHAAALLWAWSGDLAAVEKAASILVLYSLGNGLLALVGPSYVLQYAKGDLRLHLIGNTLMLIIMIPSLVWAASRWGALGTGWTWLASITAYFLIWVPLVHQRMLPGLQWNWMVKDIMPIVLSAGIASYLMSRVLPTPADRLEAGISVVTVGVMVVIAAVAASSAMLGLFRKSVSPDPLTHRK